MKKLASALAAVFGIGGIAAAADLPQPIVEEPIAPARVEQAWQGFYVGGELGYGWGKTDYSIGIDEAAAPPWVRQFNRDSYILEPDGILGGVYGGWNAQFDSFILGIDGFFDFAHLNDKNSLLIEDYTGGFAGPAIVKADIDWIAAIRARAGFAAGRVAPYVAGGVSFADFQISGFFDSVIDGTHTPTSQSQSKTVVGVNIGGGVDVAITENIIGRFDYAYHHFDEGVRIPGSQGIKIDLENIHTLKGGVAFLF